VPVAIVFSSNIARARYLASIVHVFALLVFATLFDLAEFDMKALVDDAVDLLKAVAGGNDESVSASVPTSEVPETRCRLHIIA